MTVQTTTVAAAPAALTAALKGEERRLTLVFMRVLMEYLKQRDKALHAEARATIEAFYKTKSTSQTDFASLMRALVGEYHWRKAKECMAQMLKKIGPSRYNDMKSRVQSSDAISLDLKKKRQSAEPEREGAAQDKADAPKGKGLELFCEAVAIVSPEPQRPVSHTTTKQSLTPVSPERPVSRRTTKRSSPTPEQIERKRAAARERKRRSRARRTEAQREEERVKARLAMARMREAMSKEDLEKNRARGRERHRRRREAERKKGAQDE